MKRMILASLVFLGLCQPLWAQSKPRLYVTLLTASNKGSDFNLANDAFRDKLIKLFSYTSYNQVKEFSVDLKKSERLRLDLIEGYELVLTLQEEEKSRFLLQALIRKEGKQYLDTVLAMSKPGVTFLGGPAVSAGDLIIVLESSF